MQNTKKMGSVAVNSVITDLLEGEFKEAGHDADAIRELIESYLPHVNKLISSALYDLHDELLSSPTRDFVALYFLTLHISAKMLEEYRREGKSDTEAETSLLRFTKLVTQVGFDSAMSTDFKQEH